MTASLYDRLLRKPEPRPTPEPLTALRAVRVSVGRAAAETLDLPLDVGDIAEDLHDLDALGAALPRGMLILTIRRDGAPAGLVACSAELVAAALETLTTGAVLANPPDPRPVTSTDAALVKPCFEAMLKDLARTTAGTGLDGWCDGCDLGARIQDARTLALSHPDRAYRVLSISIGDRVTDRAHRIVLALPEPHSVEAPAPAPVADPAEGWSEKLETAVMAAPYRLDAVLTRQPVSLARLTTMEVGELVPLIGTGFDAVELTGPGGRVVATGRLGQLDGRIAVRIGKPKPVQLRIEDLDFGGSTPIRPQAADAAQGPVQTPMPEHDVEQDRAAAG